MQIQGMHPNIYRLGFYALSQEKKEIYRHRYEPFVWKWRKLKRAGLSERVCQDVIGISRATYYRYEGHLKRLKEGISPPSRRPKTLRKALWGESEKQLVLRIRRESPPLWKSQDWGDS